MNALELFAIATVVNVILSTVRSIFTIKGSPLVASLVNAISYGFYTWLVVLTSAEGLTLWWKMGITFLANFVGVFIVKLCEKKLTKDKLWKIDFTVNGKDTVAIVHTLESKNIPYCYNEYGKHTMFSAFCQTQGESRFVAEIVKGFNGKYFVSENRGVL